jgi:hypothetical protein
MSNLKSINSVSPMTQSGGRGYHHKMGCKCPLCKKGGRGHNHKKGCKCPLCKKGGAEPEPDNYDDKLDMMESGNDENEQDTNVVLSNSDDENDIEKGKDAIPAMSDDYDELDEAEKGTGEGVGEYKIGGSRKRKHRRSNKTRKGKKRMTHKRHKGGKRGRKTRRHRRKH